MVIKMESETTLESIQRHLVEVEKDLDGWKSELSRPQTQANEQYRDYCETWIAICVNTIEALQKEKAKWEE